MNKYRNASGSSLIEVVVATALLGLTVAPLCAALVSIFLLPALLYVCEPIFHKTSLHWRTEKTKRAPLAARK